MSISGVAHGITPQQVSSTIRKAADGDGDGKTGAAALNDGDASAHAAARQAAQSTASAPAGAAGTPTALKEGHVDVKVV
jgi:hypothetical protein